MTCIEATDLRKRYGTTIALDGASFAVGEGRIVGIAGPNGAGKTTALHAILGLTSCEGELRVLGRKPAEERDRLMQDVAFVADVAVLPGWLRVRDAIDYVAGVHPRFNRRRALGFLAGTGVTADRRVRHLSKGAVAQLHLALVMAIDAKLLVLDEPTLGLDIMSRKQFYDALLNDYFDLHRTILIATHQVEEVQDVLTDVLFLSRGRVVLDLSMEAFGTRFVDLTVRPDAVETARAIGPCHERRIFGQTVLLYDGVSRDRLAGLGEVRTPGLSEVFVARLAGLEQSAGWVA